MRMIVPAPSLSQFWRKNENWRTAFYTLCGIVAIWAADKWLPLGELKDFCGQMKKEIKTGAKQALLNRGRARVAGLMGDAGQRQDEEAEE